MREKVIKNASAHIFQICSSPILYTILVLTLNYCMFAKLIAVQIYDNIEFHNSLSDKIARIVYAVLSKD
jgi:hypothetical protein